MASINLKILLLSSGIVSLLCYQACLAVHNSATSAGVVTLKPKKGSTTPRGDDKVDITGMAFLRPPWKLDKDFFFSLEEPAKQRRRLYPLADLVENFIWNVKGLPIKAPPPESEEIDETSNQTKVNKWEEKVNDNETRNEWIYSPYLLKDLVHMELRLYKFLKKYQRVRSPFFVMESYLKDMKDSSIRAIRHVRVSNKKLNSSQEQEDPYMYVASHPLLIYRMIRRFVEDLPPILSVIKKTNEDLIPILRDPKSMDLPTTIDLKQALSALHRLQFVNDLNSYDIAVGILSGVHTNLGLNALHCLEVGTSLLSGNHFQASIQWLDRAYEILINSNHLKRYPELEEFFRGIYHLAITQHNENFHNELDLPAVFDGTIQIFDRQVTVPFQPKTYTRRFEQLKKLATERRNVTTLGSWPLQLNFYRLCSGENLQTDREKAELKCLHHIPHSYWLLHPLQAEVLGKSPRVVQIYNFIEKSLQERVIRESIPYLVRSRVRGDANDTSDDGYRGKVTKIRTSLQTRMDETSEEHSFLRGYTRKLELLTGLHLMHPFSSEEYQVATYGPSHFYGAHVDTVLLTTNEGVEEGTRITTIMGYLSQVKAGGRTVFPVLGAFAEPIQGSIVMWDTLKRNGEHVDNRTVHGGCPVTLGVKWILNKWVFYNYNMFTYRCTLNPDE